MTIYILKYTDERPNIEQGKKVEAFSSYTVAQKTWRELKDLNSPDVTIEDMDNAITKNVVSTQTEVIALINTLA